MMNNIYWTFGCQRFESIKEFIEEVQNNCEEISPNDHGWRPYEHVCDGPLEIEFELMWKDPPDDMIYFEITRDKRSLTQAEILYKLNESSFEFFSDLDHCFFEGFDEPRNGRMYLVTGS